MADAVTGTSGVSVSSCPGTGAGGPPGGGGGSFIAGSATNTNSATQIGTGHGSVTITYVGP